MKTQNTQKGMHTPNCKKATGQQTQFDLDCQRCNKDSYESVIALRPAAKKFFESQAQHTPGPWEIKKSAIPGANYEIWTELGRKAGYAYRQEEARLIAAAPELLEAAKMALETLDFWNNKKIGGGVKTSSPTVDALKAAIAKAEGRA